ncbi:MAG: serine hydrolase domain-containing protein [Mobilicoccus sp.]|nr:serine hydrolase domain-containing protein [Mobilicoccus sp.]
MNALRALAAALLAAVVATVLVAPAWAAPRTPVEPSAADVTAWLDGMVPALIDSREVAGGVVVAVVSGGQTVALRGYGAADADAATRATTPLDPERHLVRVGSITKTMTSIAVLRLVEDGRLDLDTDVQTYLDFPLAAPRGAVTLRDLLSHTAGFEERFAGLDSHTAEGMASLRQVVSTDQPEQIFTPGEVAAYSNYGLDLAGYIVEHVTGVPYEVHIDSTILTPLGMTSSTAAQPPAAELASRVAAGFAERGSEPGAFEFIASRPAGSVSASAADMATYMNALLGHGGDDVIPSAVRTRIIEAGAMDDDLSKAGYMALGFHHEDLGGHHVLGHGGDTMLFHTQLSIAPEADLGIFVGMTGGATGDVRGEIERAFWRRYLAPTPAWEERPAGSAERAAAVAGTWRFTRRAESSFLAAISPTERISATADGDLVALGETWREVEPWVWQDDAGEARIAGRVHDGSVVAVAPTGYFAATPGGLLTSSETALTALVALAVFAVAAVTFGGEGCGACGDAGRLRERAQWRRARPVVGPAGSSSRRWSR